LHGNEMSGPQADAGKGYWGSLYGENFGNKTLCKNLAGEEVVHRDDWNTYEIVAVGSKIRMALNGHLCVDVDDPKYVRKGLFGLQIHAGGPTEVRFKDFQFEENPKFELKTLAEIFPKAVDGRVNSSGLSFAVDEHDSVDQLL